MPGASRPVPSSRVSAIRGVCALLIDLSHVVEDGVHVHDLQATILHLLGLNHEQLIYRFQGRDYRLTDVHGTVVKKLLA